MCLQATCTYDLSFIFIQAGWPGRANDAGIFNKSSSKEKLDCLLEDNARDLANSFHIVGDSAFPLHKSLMVPYDGIMGDNVDRIRSFFNKCLSSKRQVFKVMLKPNKFILTWKITIYLSVFSSFIRTSSVHSLYCYDDSHVFTS